jgi:hypothetical protein
MAAEDESIKKLRESALDLQNPLKEALNAITDMYIEAEVLNNAFLAGRVRLDEMSDAVAKSAAGVIRLGGSITDVSQTMMDIAEGSRRNVIATEEQVSKLYAASEILGVSSGTLVQNFAQVGIETSQIGPNLEESIKYVQSIGLNAKTITKDVANNMELMNRFNFSDGVQGLTKMAAQASMLRFDMNRTAEFADKVMTPEKAIEAAAGFQRLGVNIGNLVDPFALMNDAINDPGALQDSIINATKQFTEFDEKTKTFKINPQGILMLKEMADVTGISAKELSKTALAAADLDRRISTINPKLNFDKPEDKELLANMATMEGGEYVVQLKNDKTDKIDNIKLTEITNEQLIALREQQANQPKTLEDIQKSQLGTLKEIQSTLDATLAKLTYGVAGASQVRGNVTGSDRVIRAITGSVDKSVPESAKISEKITTGIKEMAAAFRDKETGKISSNDFDSKISSLKDNIFESAKGMGSQGVDALEKILKESGGKITGNSEIEKLYKSFTEKIGGNLGTTTGMESSNIGKNKNQETIAQGLQPKSIFGDENNLSQNTGQKSGTKEFNSKVDMSGNITIKVDAPAGVSQQEFKTYFESEDFKKKIYEYYNQKAKELERTK